MATTALNKKYTIGISLLELIEAVKNLKIDDKLLIEKELEKETLKYRSLKLSQRIKKNNITIDEIIEETKAVRNKKK
jgi:hypothetical protein